MSKKTFNTLLLISQTIFMAGVVLWLIGTFGHNHPKAALPGQIIQCFGLLGHLLLSLFKRKKHIGALAIFSCSVHFNA